jgi:hypothetical protein
VNARNNKGQTPLAIAIVEERKEAADVLRRYGGRE